MQRAEREFKISLIIIYWPKWKAFSQPALAKKEKTKAKRLNKAHVG